jgi:hypothetical protein
MYSIFSQVNCELGPVDDLGRRRIIVIGAENVPFNNVYVAGPGDSQMYSHYGYLHHPDSRAATFMYWCKDAAGILDSYYAEIYAIGGYLHREGDAAIIIRGYVKYWIMGGLLHREDGPAVEYADGSTEYWTNGKFISAVGAHGEVNADIDCQDDLPDTFEYVHSKSYTDLVRRAYVMYSYHCLSLDKMEKILQSMRDDDPTVEELAKEIDKYKDSAETILQHITSKLD